MNASELKPVVFESLKSIIDHIEKGGGEEVDSISTAIKNYGKLKGKAGGAAIAAQLGLNDQELSLFDGAVRDVGRKLENLDEATEASSRNTLISILRYFSWIETIASCVSAVTVPSGYKAAISDDMGRKQIRALELIVRSLVDERFGDQDTLETGLTDIFKPEVVEKWKKSGDQGNLLSGTTFSELASLFVNKQEFPNYENIFGKSTFLTFLKDRRKTIQFFLDDIRRVRNVLAHNKTVSNTQLSLLDLYYDELASPIQAAFDNGSTKVDPSSYIAATEEELKGYFSSLQEDIHSVKDDIAEFKEAVESSLGLISADTTEIKKTTRDVRKKVQLVAAGVIVLLVGVGGVLYLTSSTKEDTAEIKQQSQTITDIATQTSKDTKKISEETAAIKVKTEETQESLKEVTKAAKETTAAVLDMAQGLKNLAATGGLVTSPSNPAEHYHNARILAQRGEIDRALEAFEQLFTHPVQYADPVTGLIALLRDKYGDVGIRPGIDHAFKGRENSKLARYARLLDMTDAPPEIIQPWLDDEKPYYPALVRLTILASKNQDKWTRQRYLLGAQVEQIVIDAAQSGEFSQYYIDKLQAELDLNVVKNSHSQTNWEDLKFVREFPVTFSTGSNRSASRAHRQVIILPIIQDSTSKVEIKLSGTAKLINDKYSGTTVDQWFEILSETGRVKKSGEYFGITGVAPTNLTIIQDKLPYMYPSEQVWGCAPNFQDGEVFISARWIDTDGMESEVNDIKVCPPPIQGKYHNFVVEYMGGRIVENMDGVKEGREKFVWDEKGGAVIETDNSWGGYGATSGYKIRSAVIVSAATGEKSNARLVGLSRSYPAEYWWEEYGAKFWTELLPNGDYWFEIVINDKTYTSQVVSILNEESLSKRKDRFTEEIRKENLAEQVTIELSQYTYTGQVVNLTLGDKGVPNGFGTLVGKGDKEGNRYVGEFKAGKKHGQGTKTWPDGTTYVGEYEDGKKHGQGTLTYASGNEYVGDWKDNAEHGQGTFTYPDGAQYVGEWKDGNKHGQGTSTWADGKTEVGEYKDNERWNAIAYYADQTIAGTYTNGKWCAGCKPESTSTASTETISHTFDNGNKYVGEVKNGKMHGQGTFTYTDGAKYVGEFKNHKLHGQGIHTWADGQKYVGEWKDNNKHGQGTHTWADGQKYVGEWKVDKRWSGTQYNADGLVVGTYSSGELR